MKEILSALPVFHQVIESGSFNAAARALDLTPSAVSKSIARLESHLSVQLFHRTTRSIALTDAGESLAARTRGPLTDLEEAALYVTEMSTEPAGPLVVSCSDAFAMVVLAPMLQRFRSQFPRISVHVLQGDGPIDPQSAKFDVAIRFEPTSLPGFTEQSLIDDPWVICAAPEYLEKISPPKSPAELTGLDCLVIQAGGRVTDRWQISSEFTVDITPVFTGIGLVVREAARHGLGVARLANFLVKDDLASGRLVRLFEDFKPMEQRRIHALHRQKDYTSEKIRVFVAALERYLSRSI